MTQVRANAATAVEALVFFRQEFDRDEQLQRVNCPPDRLAQLASLFSMNADWRATEVNLLAIRLAVDQEPPEFQATLALAQPVSARPSTSCMR